MRIDQYDEKSSASSSMCVSLVDSVSQHSQGESIDELNEDISSDDDSVLQSFNSENEEGQADGEFFYSQ